MDQTERLLLAELDERVEQIFATIEKLHESVDDGKAKRELLEAIFRDVHSLKAVAASNSLDSLNRVAHEFENLLHSIRVGRSKLDGKVLVAFDQVAEALFRELSADGSDAGENQALFDQLRTLSNTSTSRRREEVDIVLSSLPEELWQSLSEGERHRLQESVGEGANLYLVSTDFDLAEFDALFQQLKDHLSVSGEVVSTAPKVGEDNPQKIDFRILYTREADLEQVRSDLASFSRVSVKEVASEARPKDLPNPEGHTIPASSRTARYGADEKSSNYIRIKLDDLDRLISSTHKLFRQTTTCLDQAVKNVGVGQDQQMESDLTFVNESFLALAAELVDLRMVAIDRILHRALRSGRAVARAAGKEIDFVVRGEELMLDKSLAEAIADPLIHLVRNAVDHGIETVNERLRRGKKETGRIVIEAASIQGQTRVTVADDGRGIDAGLVSEAAAALGVVTEGSQLGLPQCMRIIFRPGISTAGRVSGTSGRGVGLDAVEDAIEQVGGGVRVASVTGEGSSFEIRLPVTFGLLDVVVVDVGGRKYLIDAAHVLERHPFVASDVESSESTYHLKLYEEYLKLVFLSELLGQVSLRIDEEIAREVLVCQKAKTDSTAAKHIALLVDAAAGPQKVLVRNLGSRGSRWFGVAGASELRDGTVALLLDLPRLLNA